MKLISSSGFYATSTFFILSGFILTFVYKEELITNQLSRLNFIIKSLSSFYPLHLILQVAFLLMLVASIVVLGKQPAVYEQLESYEIVAYFIRSVFLIHAWEDILILNQPSWSLSALFFFYIVFVLSKPIMVSKRVMLILISLWLIYLIPPIIYYYFPDTIFSYPTIHKNPLLRLPEFLSGVVAYALYKKYQDKINVSYIIIGLLGWIITAYLVMLRPEYLPLFHNGLVLPFQIAFILGCSQIRCEALNSKLIGGLALPIFMTHSLVLNVMDFILPKLPIYISLLLNMSMVVLASYISYVFISQPLQKIIRRKLIDHNKT